MVSWDITLLITVTAVLILVCLLCFDTFCLDVKKGTVFKFL